MAGEGKDFSVDELDAMFDDLVQRGLLATQESEEEEDAAAQEINQLLIDVAGRTIEWEDIFRVASNYPDFSVEDFNQLLPPLLDNLSQGVTNIALETLDFLLARPPESFQLSEHQLENLITMLCREILDCDKDDFMRRDSSFLCLTTVIYKSFNWLGEYRGMILNLFAAVRYCSFSSVLVVSRSI